MLVFDVETKMVVDAHILIRDPDECEQRDEISAPARVKKFEARDDEEQRGHIMAEAIFAGEQVKEFASWQAGRVLRLFLAVVAGLAKNFLVGNGPRDAGDGYRQDKQPRKLEADGHR